MCYGDLMTYYSVKLNVPPDKAPAIQSLVPEGQPVSGTLIAILLDVAAQRAGSTGEPAGPAEREQHLTRRVAALERRVTRLSERLDAALAVVRHG